MDSDRVGVASADKRQWRGLAGRTLIRWTPAVTPGISSNTQAILLLTAPLIAGRGASSADLLSPGEYKRLARHLRDVQCEPGDLLSSGGAELGRACKSIVEESRLERLLGRGFLLSQVIERWHSRAIWVVSRADADYPGRLKTRLREDSPAIVYGCGDISLVETGGLAVVGSRHVDDSLTDYTIAVGGFAARAGRTIVSGGAKGIDQAAMRGALEAGGRVVGVLADSLEKTAMNRENRNLLIDGQLVLLSPYDPSAGFNVGNAMQRNKLIYALADAALVVSSDLNKGGTWAGAIQQLEKLRLVPVYVRSTGGSSPGLDALKKRGATLWPNPSNTDELETVFNVPLPTPPSETQPGLELFSYDVSRGKVPEKRQATANAQPLTESARERLSGIATPDSRQNIGKVRERPQMRSRSRSTTEGGDMVTRSETNASGRLFETVRELMQSLLKVPMSDVEVAVMLGVSTAQAKAWLVRLVEEGVLEKLTRPVRYVATSKLELL